MCSAATRFAVARIMSDNLVRILFIYVALGFKAISHHVSEEALRDFLRNDYEHNSTASCHRHATAKWAFFNNLQDKRLAETFINESIVRADLKRRYRDVYFKNLDVNYYKDPNLRRHIRNARVVYEDALEPEDYKKFIENFAEMQIIFGTSKICPYDKQDCIVTDEGLSRTDVEHAMRTSDDFVAIAYLWRTLSESTGAKLKERYAVHVDLVRAAAKANGFKDATEMLKSAHGLNAFDERVHDLWASVRPLYEEIFVFVRNRLKAIDLVADRFIPVHVLGSFSGRNWRKVANLSRPYASGTRGLPSRADSVDAYRNASADFFASIGLDAVGDSIALQDRGQSECRPETFYFCSDAAPVEPKSCPDLDYDDLYAINCERGKVQYYKLIERKSIDYRDRTDSILLEAIGNLFGLAIANPKRLRFAADAALASAESDVDHLMEQALRTVVPLAFYLAADRWRWDVFSDKINPSEWESVWWAYREEIQGVESINATGAKCFDPTMHYNVVAQEQYINKFLGTVVQFQIYKTLCTAAHVYPEAPLHKCDLYGSKDVGAVLRRAFLKDRANTDWKDILHTLTNETFPDANALLEYYRPLYRHLKLANLKDEEHLSRFLRSKYEPELARVLHDESLASYDFHADLSNRRKKATYINARLQTAAFRRRYYDEYFKHLNANDYRNETMRRHVKLLKAIGVDALHGAKAVEFVNLIVDMSTAYHSAKICPYERRSCNLTVDGLFLKPDVERVLATSFDRRELDYVWRAWQTATASESREQYERYVDLWNEAARLNGYADGASYRRVVYDEEQFVDEIDDMWELVKPIYDILHRYALKKLKERHRDVDFADNLIPATLLGDALGENWMKLEDALRPYPKLKQPDPDSVVRGNYTVDGLFARANDFYRSLGLCDSTASIGASVLERPGDGRAIDCDFGAYDMFDGRDFRLRVCSGLSFDRFLDAHHAIGYLQQYKLSKDQLPTFRTSPNPAFAYAIGQAIGLSVLTQAHLHRIGLLKYYIHIKETEMNNLMQVALYKIAFLPFAYATDKWRWDVARGAIAKSEWGSYWWHLRKVYQKVAPPVAKAEEGKESIVDPGVQFHVTHDTDFIGYFMGIVLQFQVHRGLCAAAGEYVPEDANKPLHKCNIYGSIAAGDKLRAGLSLGSTKDWREALYAITGEKKLDASALLEYFNPLYEELIEETEEVDYSLEICIACILAVLAILLIYLSAKWLMKPNGESSSFI